MCLIFGRGGRWESRRRLGIESWQLRADTGVDRICLCVPVAHRKKVVCWYAICPPRLCLSARMQKTSHMTPIRWFENCTNQKPAAQCFADFWFLNFAILQFCNFVIWQFGNLAIWQFDNFSILPFKPSGCWLHCFSQNHGRSVSRSVVLVVVQLGLCSTN